MRQIEALDRTRPAVFFEDLYQKRWFKPNSKGVYTRKTSRTDHICVDISGNDARQCSFYCVFVCIEIAEHDWERNNSFQRHHQDHKTVLERSAVVAISVYMKGCETEKTKRIFRLWDPFVFLRQSVYPPSSSMILGHPPHPLKWDVDPTKSHLSHRIYVKVPSGRGIKSHVLHPIQVRYSRLRPASSHLSHPS